MRKVVGLRNSFSLEGHGSVGHIFDLRLRAALRVTFIGDFRKFRLDLIHNGTTVTTL